MSEFEGSSARIALHSDAELAYTIHLKDRLVLTKCSIKHICQGIKIEIIVTFTA